MKMKAVLLTAVVAVAIAGSTYAADYNWNANPSATWFGYVNAFELDGTTFATGFPEATFSTASANWSGSTLTMSPNTRLYDETIGDGYWVDQITFEPNKVIEFNYYQEGIAAVGETLQFDFAAIANSLPAGYEARAFVKVLDGFASWATTQYDWVDLSTLPSGPLGLTVASPGGGTPFIQAGFSVKGVAVTAGSATALTGVQIIPEPATIGLVGIAGLGMFIARRRFMI